MIDQKDMEELEAMAASYAKAIKKDKKHIGFTIGFIIFFLVAFISFLYSGIPTANKTPVSATNDQEL